MHGDNEWAYITDLKALAKELIYFLTQLTEDNMDQILAFFILVAFLGIGEIISVKTHAKLPSLFIGMILVMLGFWVGIPKDLIAKTGLPALTALATPVLVASMGTLMSLKQIAKQWKVVLVCIGALVGVGVFLLTIGKAIYGLPIAIAAACPISGGIVATLIAEDAMKAAGRPELAVLAVLFLVLQSLIGMPFASALLARDVKKNWDKIMAGKSGTTTTATPLVEKKLIPPLPKDYQTPFFLLAKIALVGWLAYVVAGFMHNAINVSIVAILFGLIAYALGFLEGDILTKAGAFTLFMLLLLASVLGVMNLATPALVLSYIGPIIIGFILGIAGIVLMSVIVGKLVKLSWEMSVAVGLNCLLGFPPNFVVVQELSKAMGKDEAERKAIMDYLLPPMLVGGYVTVTIGSVIFAGIIVKFL